MTTRTRSSSVRKTSAAPRAGEESPQAPNRSQMSRMLEIHNVLREGFGSRRRLNCTTMGKRLGMSAKTILRDLTYMKDTLGLPVDYDGQEKSYSYPSSDVSFPVGPDLTQDERIAISVARQTLEVFRGVNFADHLASAHDKLFDGFLSQTGLSIEGDLSEYISVRTPGAGIADPKTFKAVVKALLERRELRVKYQAKGRPAATPRRLAPYHLACVASRWVLVALDLEKQDVRTYILARMTDPVITQDPIDRPPNFDVSRHLGTSFGVWTGSGEIVVRLRLAAVAAHHVRERHWHATQKLTELPEGEVEVAFKLSDLNDVTRWILGFGGDCRVMEPKELKAAVREEAEAMLSGSRFSGKRRPEDADDDERPGEFVGFKRSGA